MASSKSFSFNIVISGFFCFKADFFYPYLDGVTKYSVAQ